MSTQADKTLAIVNKFFPKVRKVRDATRDLLIEVTKDDTESAAVKKHQECALAVACKRKLRIDGAIISVSRAYMVVGDTAVRYEVPATISREIVSFDRGAGFGEGSYVLYKMAPRAARRHRPAHPVKRSTRPKPPRHVTAGIRTALR